MQTRSKSIKVVLGGVALAVAALAIRSPVGVASPLLGSPTTTTTAAPSEDVMERGPQQEASMPEPAAAARLLELANEARAEVGAPPLVARADVADIAQRWSEKMASDGEISHNDEYFSSETKARLGADLEGENVGKNIDVDDAHRLFMSSDGHRANLLDARFTVVGMGAVFRDGYWWVTQDFLQPNDSPAVSTGAVVVATDSGAAVPAQIPAPAPSTTLVTEAAATDASAPVTTSTVPEAAEPESALSAITTSSGLSIATQLPARRSVAPAAVAALLIAMMLTAHAARRMQFAF